MPRLFDDDQRPRSGSSTSAACRFFALRERRPQGLAVRASSTRSTACSRSLLVLLSPGARRRAVAVRLSSPGPVLFRQRRVGRDGQVFDLLKFRSMRELAPHPLAASRRAGRRARRPGGVEGEDRRTRVGRLLRRTSLDELPQLLNVLRGRDEPGRPAPRAPRVRGAVRGQIVDRYDDRHRVKSGITGWAQVHGLRGTDLDGRPRRVGQLLHPELVAPAGPQDPADDAAEVLRSRSEARASRLQSAG